MSYYTKITKAGLAAITAAMNNNSKVPITYMAFGDGNGYIPEPDENATSLVNEVYRVGVNKVEVHNKNPNWLVCEAIIPSAVGGFNIREVALYDSTGNTMLAIASYPPTYKPTVEEGAAKIQTIRIVIQVDNSGNFELIVDPDVVLATTAYVNQQDNLILQYISVNSYADLKELVPSFENQRAVLSSYVEGKNLGGGTFRSVRGNLSEDGGYTCKVNNEWAWKRCSIDGTVYLTEFGLVEGATIDTMLDNAIKFCIANKRQKLVIPTTGSENYILNGGLQYDLNNCSLVIDGGNPSRGGQRIHHVGANIGLYFRSYADMWSPVKLRNFNILGSASSIAFVRFSDSWNNEFNYAYVSGYTNGSIVELYNYANWTEGFKSEGVIARSCKNGFFFHRNPNTNASSVYPDKHPTESFYRTKIKDFNFQHGITASSNAILIGDPSTESDSYSICNLYSSEIDLGGWFEGGGDSTGIHIRRGSKLSISHVAVSYDGTVLTSVNPPSRVFKLASDAKVDNCTMESRDSQTGIIDISSILQNGGITAIYPFRGLVFKSNEYQSINGIDTFDMRGASVAFKVKVPANNSTILRLQRLFKSSDYRVKIVRDDARSATYNYHSQGLTNVGYLINLSQLPLVQASSQTTASGNPLAYTTETNANLAVNPMSSIGATVRLLNNKNQGEYSTAEFLGFEITIPEETSERTFTVYIEKIT